MVDMTTEVENPTIPTSPWFVQLLGLNGLEEGEKVEACGVKLTCKGGILRADGVTSKSQWRTGEAFAYLWEQPARFQSVQARSLLSEWYRSHFGDIERAAWWEDYGSSPLVLDVGCGVGHSAFELFRERLRAVRYVGVDISTAVDRAARRFVESGIDGAFVQADLMHLPFAPKSFDVIYAQGVLHHTDSTERAIRTLTPLLSPGGRFVFYVYRRKGPIREFTDDLVRERLQHLSHERAWEEVMKLTRLGVQLGELRSTVEIEEPIPLLGIPAGRIDVQRLFYWHVFKCFYHPHLTLDEMNHINFDWYAPPNAQRQTPEQVRKWCISAGLEVEHEHLEEAGIAVIARRTERGRNQRTWRDPK